MAVPTNCQTYTPPARSTPILTVSIPGGLAINLLGIHVDVCPVCVTVYTDGTGRYSSSANSGCK